MERQSKGSRGLEAYCKGGQGLPWAVAPPKKNMQTCHRQFDSYHGTLAHDCDTTKLHSWFYYGVRNAVDIWNVVMNVLDQCFSIFVRSRRGKFFFS